MGVLAVTLGKACAHSGPQLPNWEAAGLPEFPSSTSSTVIMSLDMVPLSEHSLDVAEPLPAQQPGVDWKTGGREGNGHDKGRKEGGTIRAEKEGDGHQSYKEALDLWQTFHSWMILGKLLTRASVFPSVQWAQYLL